MLPCPTAFTLNKLANALRGIPRDAVMLVRLPDGTLRQIDHLEGAKVAADAAESGAPSIDTSSQSGRYAVVMVVADAR